MSKEIEKTFYCNFVEKLTGKNECCRSCHNDDEEFFIEMNTRKIKKRNFYLCCKMTHVLDEYCKEKNIEYSVY